MTRSHTIKNLEQHIRAQGFLKPGETIPVVSRDELYNEERKAGYCVENDLITVLSIHDCEWTSLPESMGESKDLTGLYLHSKRLTPPPACIGRLTRLTTLDLRHTASEAIPNSFW